MSSRWQANKIGLLNFWYYDDQEFPFLKGRMLLRGSNGSGKSVTMQSVVPLLLDGNMSPERLDPFGSRDRKMSSYLLEEDDGRDERTGYLYLEFKRQETETYLTIGMGIRARRGKNLDKWYFSLTDGRRVGKDFFLYKEMEEKVPLSRRELENRIGEGGRVMERQAEYVEYVNRHIFGFETVEEYKEMIDLLIQLRTPKLSKDFKPSVINDILSDSLQPLSDEDLRPMSEAIENMDAMNMNLKSRKEASQAAEKIYGVFSKYNQWMLYDKADRYAQARQRQEKLDKEIQEEVKQQTACIEEIERLSKEQETLDAKNASMEKERDTLSKSDALALKKREEELREEITAQEKKLEEKQQYLEHKQERILDVKVQLKAEEDRLFGKEKEIRDTLEQMCQEADQMGFEEHTFMQDELGENLEKEYSFATHQQIFEETQEKISEGTELLIKTDQMERSREELLKEREIQLRELDSLQRRAADQETAFMQAQSQWKEDLHRWQGESRELKLSREHMQELCVFADTYHAGSDFASVRSRVADVWIQAKTSLETELSSKKQEHQGLSKELGLVQMELADWEQKKEPEPERTEAVIRNRERLTKLGIPYQELYMLLEFSSELSAESCDRLEEALHAMGILDALVIDEAYREQVLVQETGCEDRYLFRGTATPGRSLLDVLEINGEVNDLFTNYRMTGILGSIAYDGDFAFTVNADGTYQMGPLHGTTAGDYHAGFIGSKAREQRRLEKIAQCQKKIQELQQAMETLSEEMNILLERKDLLKAEYEACPDDASLREALKQFLETERECELMKKAIVQTEEKTSELLERLKEVKTKALEIAQSLYLTCSLSVFQAARDAANAYSRYMERLKGAHQNYRQILEHMQISKDSLEALEEDLDQVRYDLTIIRRDLLRKQEEVVSIGEQLSLTDYEQIKDRLLACTAWLRAYPEKLMTCTQKKTREEEREKQLRSQVEENRLRKTELEEKVNWLAHCYEQECRLSYVDLPENLKEHPEQVCAYLETDCKTADKDSIVRDLNRVYFENRGYLTDYQLMQKELFAEETVPEGMQAVSPRRLDMTARYQGVGITFAQLIAHLKEDIAELENLIRDGDRELFEDILANTVSRKIRSKINASNTWVQKMNSLMNGMNTSSGLKLSLRWRSKTAEEEDQLDTKELVELLKKDYRLMSEGEAAKLSGHFRSKVAQARRNAKDSAGMISFYQIMKDTLDYRKWFEFQLFYQKSGERQKELTNSAFGTFSGGEKAMSMYVPLFSAVVAKYQGGRADAPRVISLDEAFAGVDNRNIRDMFRLMAEFEFDFIINSQVLWGDCDTLDALAIYQLIRPENAKFVTVMPYRWNGYARELLEDEAHMEEDAKMRT